jgi:hypothetical protein
LGGVANGKEREDSTESAEEIHRDHGEEKPAENKEGDGLE